LLRRLLSKKYLKLILKISFSFIVLYFLVKGVNLSEIKNTILKSDIRLFILVFLIYLLGQAFCSYRWKIIGSALGFKDNFFKYMQYYFIGMFFNLFLPTTIGGDAVKCFYISKTPDNPGKLMALYSVLADRFAGVIIISLMATLGLVSTMGKNIVPMAKMPFILLSVGLFTSIFIPNILSAKFQNNRFITNLANTLDTFIKKPDLAFRILFVGLVFHLMVVFIHVLIGKMIGINVPYAYYFIVYPISALAGFIPISFNGLGPREFSYVYLLGLAGVRASDAISFSIIWFAVIFFSSLCGTIFYVKSSKGVQEAPY
jgi:glycosyltransferase 2 family protein